MQITNDELRSLLHNVISCYRDHVNVYRTANPEDEAVNDVMQAAQQQRMGGTCSACGGVLQTGIYCAECGAFEPANR